MKNSIVKGKTTFKEEFVTCAGVSFHDVDPSTMGSKQCPGLFFAGEVMDRMASIFRRHGLLDISQVNRLPDNMQFLTSSVYI